MASASEPAAAPQPAKGITGSKRFAAGQRREDPKRHRSGILQPGLDESQAIPAEEAMDGYGSRSSFSDDDGDARAGSLAPHRALHPSHSMDDPSVDSDISSSKVERVGSEDAVSFTHHHTRQQHLQQNHALVSLVHAHCMAVASDSGSLTPPELIGGGGDSQDSGSRMLRGSLGGAGIESPLASSAAVAMYDISGAGAAAAAIGGIGMTSPAGFHSNPASPMAKLSLETKQENMANARPSASLPSGEAFDDAARPIELFPLSVRAENDDEDLDTRPPGINDCTDDLLKRIFRLVVSSTRSSSYLLSLSLVCRRWRTIVKKEEAFMEILSIREYYDEMKHMLEAETRQQEFRRAATGYGLGGAIAHITPSPGNDAALFFSRQHLTPQMRSVLVDWLHEVSDEMQLVTETTHKAVRYFDSFMARCRDRIPRQELQLIGVSCLFIATKFEEVLAPVVGDMCYVTADTYTAEQVIAAEAQILCRLQFDTNVVTAYSTLEYLCEIATHGNLPHEVLPGAVSSTRLFDWGRLVRLARALVDFSLLDARLTNARPTLLACGAVVAAMHCVGGFGPQVRAPTLFMELGFEEALIFEMASTLRTCIGSFWDGEVGQPGYGVRRRFEPKPLTPEHQVCHAQNQCACDPQREFDQLCADVRHIREYSEENDPSGSQENPMIL